MQIRSKLVQWNDFRDVEIRRADQTVRARLYRSPSAMYSLVSFQLGWRC
jgi:hypothetical protein